MTAEKKSEMRSFAKNRAAQLRNERRHTAGVGGNCVHRDRVYISQSRSSARTCLRHEFLKSYLRASGGPGNQNRAPEHNRVKPYYKLSNGGSRRNPNKIDVQV